MVLTQTLDISYRTQTKQSVINMQCRLPYIQKGINMR